MAARALRILVVSFFNGSKAITLVLTTLLKDVAAVVTVAIEFLAFV